MTPPTTPPAIAPVSEDVFFLGGSVEVDEEVDEVEVPVELPVWEVDCARDKYVSITLLRPSNDKNNSPFQNQSSW